MKTSTQRALIKMQIIASIMPIIANITIVVISFMQHQWMMIAMIIPSTMMYLASIIPQLIQQHASIDKNITFIDSLKNKSEREESDSNGSKSCVSYCKISDLKANNTNYANSFASSKSSELVTKSNESVQYNSANSSSANNDKLENNPDNINPIILEKILLNNKSNATSNFHNKNIALIMPPWREIVRQWLLSLNSTNTKYQSSYNTPQAQTQAKSMQRQLIATIGVKNCGYMNIDLVKNGPHALVAGTTGSGKSILLTTWCLSLAFKYPPSVLRFVFMDFKGGATFDSLANLPHNIGNVGDLNLKHATRALQGLEQELDRRERLVAQQGCNNITQVKPYEPSIVIVIDEFHALKDQLPHYMNRLIRIASVGRSLGMHIIACTQNPLGQVNADMKANISINLCLRVRDALQSHELLGSSCAAYINPQSLGGAYCNLGEGITAVRCSEIANTSTLIEGINLAGKFYHYNQAEQLFSKPLPSIVTVKQAEKYSKFDAHDKASNRIHKNNDITIGLLDDGIRLYAATLPLNIGNIAIIGTQGRGKTNILRLIDNLLKANIADGENREENTNHPYIVDNADALVNPLNNNPDAIYFQEQLASSNTVIFSVKTAHRLRLPDQAPVRIIFPTGDAGTDTMLGIPSEIQQSLTPQDYHTPGRAVLIYPGHAYLLQLIYFENT